jgi:transcriptional regulator with XRE-family HTH domain
MDSASIGTRIRTFRLRAGLTQEQLGERVGLSYQQIQKYEHGESKITVDLLYRLSRVFQIPVVEFIPPTVYRAEDADQFTREPGGKNEPQMYQYIESPQENRMLQLFRSLQSAEARELALRHLELLLHSERPDSSS